MYSWYQRSTSWDSYRANNPSTTLTTETNTFYNVTWSCTSTCGSVCYAEKPITTASYLITSTGYRYNYPPEFKDPWPNCYINPQFCRRISMNSTTSFNTTQQGLPGTVTSKMDLSFAKALCVPEVTKCCISGLGLAQLWYWPDPITTTRDMCTSSPASSGQSVSLVPYQGYKDNTLFPRQYVEVPQFRKSIKLFLPFTTYGLESC